MTLSLSDRLVRDLAAGVQISALPMFHARQDLAFGGPVGPEFIGQPFAVRVRVVLPGRAPETSFGRNAMARSQDGIPEAYAGLAQRIFASW